MVLALLQKTLTPERNLNIMAELLQRLSYLEKSYPQPVAWSVLSIPD
jgi:hypothetical protein